MNPFRWARLRLRAIVARRRLERDMQEEMREHLVRATERFMARGMCERDARLAAKREFGNLTMLQAEARDARGGRWVDALSGDTRFALRYFARHKATTAIIVAVLALGTGANTLIFSILQAQFLRPPPAVPKVDAHVRIWGDERATVTTRWERRGFSLPELAALAARRDVFQAVAAWTEDEVILRGDSGGARGVAAQFVTPNFFRVLGVPLQAGQGFRQDAGGAPDLAAIMAWADAERLHGDAAGAVGRRLLVNEVPVYVVGVAPPGFQGAQRHMDEPALWMPVSARADVARVPPRWLEDEATLSLFARLAPGASRERATALARQVVATTLPDSAAHVGMARSAHVLAMHALPPGNARFEMAFTIVALMCIGLLILLVGWTNVSALMVAAAVGRRHEIAVRLSLGASRVRVLRQLVTESTLLALAGSAVGLLLAWWTITWIAKSDFEGLDVTPDLGTFAFVLALALATGILFGLSPALHAVGGGVATALRDSGVGAGAGARTRLQRGFVVAQIALSQPLLVLLGVMISLTIADYRPLSPGLGRHVIRLGLTPLATGAPGQRPEDVEALLARIAERPEVLATAFTPASFTRLHVAAPDRAGRGDTAHAAPTVVHVAGTAPGWFGLVDVPILLGRDVSLADTAAGEHPVVIGSDLARARWGDANPLGRTLASTSLPGTTRDSLTMTVVGVYDAARSLPDMAWYRPGVRGGPPAPVFTAHGRRWRHDLVLVRTRGPAAAFVPELQRFVRAAAPALPLRSMRTLAQVDEAEYLVTLRVGALAGAGGAVALLLASLGLYGVVSLAVRQRTREIGIRIAVGAHPMRVARMFLASGVRAGLVALALGLPLSIVALELGLSQGLLIAARVNPYAIGIVIALLLLAVAAAATWVPARRAALVDPARTLRVE